MKKKESKIWDRFPNETEAPWLAFVAYQKMSQPRNISALAETLGYKAPTLHVWSSEFLWADRVEHYDRWLDQKRTRAAGRASEKAGERLARKAAAASEAAVELAMLGIKRVLHDMRDGQHTDATLTQFARLLRDGTQMGRLVLGDSTERIEHKHDLKKLTDEELDQLDALIGKASQ